MYLKHIKLSYNFLYYNKIVTITNPQTINDKIKVTWQLFAGVLKQGTKDCYNEFKQVQSYNGKFTQSNQLYQKYHTDRELFKVFPFLFIFIAPGGFLYIPMYAFLFPNSIPTYYLFEDQFYNRQNRKYNIQVKAQQKLYQSQNIIKNIQNSTQLKELFLQKKDVIDKQLNINNLNSDQLELICQHFQMEYISLLSVPNKIYHTIFNFPVYFKQIYDYAIGYNHGKYVYQDPHKILNIGRPFFIEYLRQKLMLQQINNYFNYINNADYLHNYQDYNYQKYCLERGLTKKMSRDEYNLDWIKFNQTNYFTNTQKIWYSVYYSQLK